MKLRKLVPLVLSLSLVLVALAACGGKTAETAAPEQDLLEQIKARGSIVIATEGDWSPWTYHDESDTLTGFDVELGQLIAEGLGVTAQFQETDWDSILTGVETGRFDIACNGVDWTEERAKSYNFSDPYVYTEIVLVVAEGNEDIHSIDDLKGRTTANSPNSTYAQRAEAAGATVTYVNTLAETIQALEQGRVEATINAKGSIEDYLGEHPDAKIKVVYECPGDPVCIPAGKSVSSESLTAEINRVLGELRQSGKLAALSVKYFGVDLTTQG